jgi:hypothetical protein
MVDVAVRKSLGKSPLWHFDEALRKLQRKSVRCPDRLRRANISTCFQVWVLIDEDYAWELCEAHEHFVDPREVLQLCQRSLGSGKSGIRLYRH